MRRLSSVEAGVGRERLRAGHTAPRPRDQNQRGPWAMHDFQRNYGTGWEGSEPSSSGNAPTAEAFSGERRGMGRRTRTAVRPPANWRESKSSRARQTRASKHGSDRLVRPTGRGPAASHCPKPPAKSLGIDLTGTRLQCQIVTSVDRSHTPGNGLLTLIMVMGVICQVHGTVLTQCQLAWSSSPCLCCSAAKFYSTVHLTWRDRRPDYFVRCAARARSAQVHARFD